jgi:hypothetical protein
VAGGLTADAVASPHNGVVALTLGFCSRTGSAVGVAVDDDAGFVGRWSVDLTEGRVPGQVFHAAAGLPRPEAESLVRRATETVTGVAGKRLSELLAAVGPVEAVGVIVGNHPVPESITTILAAHTLMHAAEGALYRDALLDAAAGLGLRGIGLPRLEAEARLAGDLAETVRAMGAHAGRPWRKEHKLAAVAALGCLR